MPSTKAWGRSASWHLVEIITALARIRVNDNLPKSWLVTTLSATPLHLASAAAAVATTSTESLHHDTDHRDDEAPNPGASEAHDDDVETDAHEDRNDMTCDPLMELASADGGPKVIEELVVEAAWLLTREASGSCGSPVYRVEVPGHQPQL